MPVFEYTARDAGGQQSRGTVEAADRNGAMTQISAQGLFPVSITGGSAAVEAAAAKPAFAEDAPRRRSPAKPKLQELANYTRQLANLLKAGMPLTASLSSMINLEGSGVPVRLHLVFLCPMHRELPRTFGIITQHLHK